MNIRDYIVFNRYRIYNWLQIALLVFKRGPMIIRDLKKYPWIFILLRVNSLMKRLIQGRSGHYLRANALVISSVVAGMVDLLEGIFFEKKNLIIHEDMVPPEILRAMGFSVWMPELLGILLPMIEPSAMEKYIDASENEGIPADICSLPKSTLGLLLNGQMPEGQAVVTSNLPCDGGMTSYEIIQDKTGLPVFRLDVPHNFKTADAEEYFKDELLDMIQWLEETTGKKMDWDRLKDICEERNKMLRAELELWEMITMRPAPMAAEPIYLSHLWAFNVMPGKKTSTELIEKIAALAEKNIKKKTPAVCNEKFRALLWNPPTLHLIDLFVQAEKDYGISLIIDSMSYNDISLIDTETKESMLRGLGRTIMEGPMARHTRGPSENYFNDIFRIIKQFDIDMLWVAGHVSCKNTRALYGMLREECRRENIPLLIIDYDLSDPRIMSRQGILSQVDHFMENIMGVKKRGNI